MVSFGEVSSGLCHKCKSMQCALILRSHSPGTNFDSICALCTARFVRMDLILYSMPTRLLSLIAHSDRGNRYEWLCDFVCIPCGQCPFTWASASWASFLLVEVTGSERDREMMGVV